MGSAPNWYQTGIKTSFIPKVSKFYVEIGYLCQQAWKCHLWNVSMHFTGQNIVQRKCWGPHVIEFRRS